MTATKNYVHPHTPEDLALFEKFDNSIVDARDVTSRYFDGLITRAEAVVLLTNCMLTVCGQPLIDLQKIERAAALGFAEFAHKNKPECNWTKEQLDQLTALDARIKRLETPGT